MYVYDNLPEAINDLHRRGFIVDFNVLFNDIVQAANIELTIPSGLEIVEHYRFEANTNPADSSVLYAIQTRDAVVKGIIINAYGVYSEAINDDIIGQLSVHEKMVDRF